MDLLLWALDRRLLSGCWFISFMVVSNTIRDLSPTTLVKSSGLCLLQTRCRTFGTVFKHHQAEYVLVPADYAPQVQADQGIDGIPVRGLNSLHTRSRAGSAMDLGTPAKRPPVPQRSHTSSFESVGMGMGMSGGGVFPSTGFGSSIGAGRPRAGSRARTLDGGAAAGMLGRTVELWVYLMFVHLQFR
ncbi:hypothetical protein M407DRAFT_244658 [Tulasnella calospora MUT 4182]|uniref:Uncharacterized protein n=1 Tax=Tulasnella calospora MUT 4182 TaxID=1051891 RepID=A0A0C3LQW5_9AGAM|nr:hypothetical protein M407DRAFT_244658 [Tulasnella calospora MUT 4182]